MRKFTSQKSNGQTAIFIAIFLFVLCLILSTYVVAKSGFLHSIKSTPLPSPVPISAEKADIPYEAVILADKVWAEPEMQAILKTSQQFKAHHTIPVKITSFEGRKISVSGPAKAFWHMGRMAKPGYRVGIESDEASLIGVFLKVGPREPLQKP